MTAKPMSDDELEAIRLRTATDVFVESDDMSRWRDRVSLVKEVDRLRRLDGLAREWLRAHDEHVGCAHRLDNHAFDRLFDAYQGAREAYRAAAEEKHER